MTRPSVLVVGAGPTGLLMACQLLRLDIPFRIIDAKAGPTTESRALAIQARSLEILAQMGIAAAAVAQGKQGKAISYVVNGTLTQRISLEGFGNGLTAFPYLLILEQSKTEQLLVDFLRQRDHRVEWNTELVSIARDQGGVSAHVRGAGKRGETVRVPWLVGADGAKSVVRHSLGIPFVGETYRRSLFVLDCRVDLPFRNDEMYTAFSADSFAAFFPMTDGRCRVAGVLPDELADDDEVTFQEVNRHFAERLKMRVVLSDPHWISRYHAHHRYAAAFRRGRCFLAGDAAHIHSPVGGQGMNTGLQDAYNLAWKLALVIRGAADPRLLDTYNQERLPVGKRLVRTTDRAFNVTVSRNPFTVFMRLHVAPHLLAFGMKLGPVQRLAFESISQIGITYRGSSLSRGASRGRFPRSAPRPGDRLPYALMAGGAASVNVQEKVSGTTLHLLIFSGVEDGERARALRSMVDRRYPGTVTADTIALTAGTASLYRRFGLEREGWYLIRPDMHIASRNDQLDVEGLVEALARVLRLGQTRAG